MKKWIFLIIILLGATSTIFAQETTETLNISQLQLDRLWVLISAALVFFMQAGFLALEVGLVRSHSITAVGMKNAIDFIVGSLAFYMVGFALMFGHSWHGLIGTDIFFLFNLEFVSDGNPLGLTFFIFQVGFAATAITIVSGALAERIGFISYLVASAVIGLIIYPIFGHWVWGSAFFGSNQAWLADLGFIDFAGSSVVHATGGWIAFVGALILGPRLGRYKKDGSITNFKPNNIAFSVLGTFILWLGWYGFNGGSTLAFNEDVDNIILNTTIAAIGGGIAAFFHSFFFQNKKEIYEKMIGGLLGGLVAITASCHLVSVVGSLCIGILAGVVHNLSFNFIAKVLKIDDPVGAIPVHAVCGTLGIIILPFFALPGTLSNSILVQFSIQVLGSVVCFVWAVGLGYLTFMFIKKFFGLRVSPQEENAGITIPGTLQEEEEEEEEIDMEMLKELMGDEKQ